jgi:hypothetical protein
LSRSSPRSPTISSGRWSRFRTTTRFLSRGHAALLAQAQEPATSAHGGGRCKPLRACQSDPQLLSSYRGAGQ